ncbi:hypothetical protein GCM10027275_39590 [Rhabdobacter roseus]|uniref:Phage shock protein PspC (Stress-responsive transcriptional regulator) n=1 Tax=Rhabdobacter roseus TaxID=1655419 RepID=A0A840TRX6_9BACT|nr:PspC domain-containing protein [Rhabdobacter roseus]MBB5285665.1 phage shock protein PspC (stress-responsive transcriptional regulator) [Rhabdobacter roseus]
MKKTISINISGIIFHIEEDGYDKLKNYLNSVQKYFSSFADSKEILSDIEGRIAERFLSKQKTESKQVISLEDVDELIAAMGTVADFEAIDQAEDLLSEPLQPVREEAFSAQPKAEPDFTAPRTSPPKAEKQSTFAGTRRLVRDLRRKLLGGVAAGLAHYFSIDPLWVRLAFLITVIGLPVGAGIFNLDEVFGPLAGMSVILYIAMWVAFPGSASLEEDTRIKKFYRDPDRKVVGGVAGGVASYFGVDLGVVRFLWVLAIFLFGTGFLFYIILWVISPAANTLTEKMEMQGEPITLSNIETNIKKGLNLNETEAQESALTKILLLPFRAIALIIGALGKILKGIGPILRVVIGAFLVAMAVVSLLGMLIGGGIGLGMRNVLPFTDIPPLMILNEMPSTLILSIVLITVIPFIVILLLGLTLIANRRITSGSVWLTLAGLWVVGLLGAAISGAAYQRNFARRGEVVETDYFSKPRGVLTLDERSNDLESNWEPRVELLGYDESDSIRLDRIMSARGQSLEDARRFATDLEYAVVMSDSLLIFDEKALLNERSRFRDQELRMTLYLPYNQPFAMTHDFYHGKLQRWRGPHKYLRTYNLDRDEVDWRNLRWVVRRDSGLVCINIPADFIQSETEEEEDEEEEYSYNEYDNESSSLNLGNRGRYSKQFSEAGFEGVDLGGAYAVDIRQGEAFKVSVDSDDEEAIDNLKVYVQDNVLHVERPGEFRLFGGKSKRIGLVITMPTIKSLELSGANKTRVSGFKNLNELKIAAAGATSTELNVEVNRLDIGVAGASKMILKGKAQSLKADLAGACKLDATAMSIENADVDAAGASKAELGTVRSLRKRSSGASKIEAQVQP